MRIISGTAGGIKLQVPKGEVRPTTDRVREALFSILGETIHNARILDLFAGSGAFGIEALSRGAKSVRFVDILRSSCNIIKDNLAKTALQGGYILQADAVAAIRREPEAVYDIIFADPPYCKYVGDRDFIKELMKGRLHEILADGGYFIAEAELGWGVGDATQCEFDGWKIIDRRSYGKNTLIFYQKNLL